MINISTYPGNIFKKAIKNQAVALGCGAFAASALRLLCHFISGVTIWGEYANGWKSVWIYALAYNGSFMAAEAVLSVIGVVVLGVIFDFNKENLLRKGKLK